MGLKKTFKISFVIIVTLIMISIATWIFLKNTINGEFITTSEKVNQAIASMPSPRSGELIMEKYLIKSEETINKFSNLPIFPLLTRNEKKEMEIKILSVIKLLKRKYEKWEGADFAKTRESYSRIINKFQELFPDTSITNPKLLKLTSPKIISIQEKTRITLPDTSVQLNKKKVEPGLINKENLVKTDKKSIEKKISGIVVEEGKNIKSERNYTITIPEIGKNIDEKVTVYLKSGREVKGVIKAVDKRFLFLDINFKGGKLAAKLIIRDIEKIERVIEENDFYLIEE